MGLHSKTENSQPVLFSKELLRRIFEKLANVKAEVSVTPKVKYQIGHKSVTNRHK